VSRYRLKTMIPPVKTWSVDLSCSIGFIPALLRHTHTKKKRKGKLLLAIASFQGTKHRPALSEGPGNAL